LRVQTSCTPYGLCGPSCRESAVIEVNHRDVTGRIFDVQRFSVHDGPGIRTTVFLKGCPLRCRWCHNPESIDPRPQISFLPSACIGCKRCMEVCPRGAHRVVDGERVFDRQRCEVCGKCVEECYAEALEMVGRDATVGEVLDEVLRDRCFYETSGGGMTLSGGEPLSQIDFTDALLAAAKDANLHTCVETCGLADYKQLDRIRPMVDLFLYDWKETDPQRHKQSTGVSNERIAANLRALHAAGAKILLRCPIIPGLNDREGHFEGIARLARELDGLEGVELMPYHKLGESKTARFGLTGEDRISAEAPSRETVDAWNRRLADRGVKTV